MFDFIALRKNFVHFQDPNNQSAEEVIATQNGSETTALVAVEAPNQGSNCSAALLSLIFFLVPITLITYGVVHFHDCPAENRIAISLIVLGGLTAVTRFLNCPYEFRKIFRGRERFRKNLYLISLNMILQTIMLCFFIAMSYWIFTIKPDTKPGDGNLSNYCELQFYRNTYWTCIVGLIIIGIIFIVGCGFMCMLCAAAFLVHLHVQLRS